MQYYKDMCAKEMPATLVITIRMVKVKITLKCLKLQGLNLEQSIVQGQN